MWNMLIKRKTEMDLQNDRLFLISNSRCNEPRTSSPFFHRKTFRRSNDVPEDYKKFREGLERPLKKNLVLNRGVEMSLPPDESFISGHLFFTKEDLDMFNEPIKEEDIRQTLSNKIIGLLNGSYKTLIKKTSGLFRKKRTQDPRPTCSNINECECRRRHFLDLDNVKNDRGFCHASKANIILL